MAPRNPNEGAMRPRDRDSTASAGGCLRSVEREITDLECLSLEDLRGAWRSKLGSEPPRVRAREFLLRLLTWTIQAKCYGGFGPDTVRRLKRLSRDLAANPDRTLRVTTALPVGATLIREWKGVSHQIDVVDGAYVFEGKTYKTLSMIARVITKTRWSGPRFFGLEEEAVQTIKAKRT